MFDVALLTINVPIVDLKPVDSSVNFRAVCGVNDKTVQEGALGGLETCPSPCSTYEVSFGDRVDETLHAYLNTVDVRDELSKDGSGLI